MLVALVLYLFAAAFFAGPATKRFRAGALSGVTVGLFGIFGGFVMSSQTAWLNPLVYQVATAVGVMFGGLGAVARASLHGGRESVA